MPRADDFSVLDDASAERASLVKARVFHGVDLSVHVSDADQLVSAGEFFAGVEGGKVGLGSEFDERHGFDSSEERSLLAALQRNPHPRASRERLAAPVIADELAGILRLVRLASLTSLRSG